MSLPQYNTEELIKNIKRRCTVPTSQLTYEDVDFCALATDEMQDIVVPMLMSVKSEYFLTFKDYFTDNSAEIIIPEDAVGEKLRSVVHVQSTDPLNMMNLPRIDLDVVNGLMSFNYNYFYGFYIQGNKLMLYPNKAVPTGTNIRVYYFKRVLSLATPDNYCRVQSIDPDTNSIVVDLVPVTWQIGDKLNSVSDKPAFQTTNEEMTITNLSNPTIFLDTVEGIVVGDYISQQGYSAVPQIPLETHAYLAQLTAVKCLEGLSDRAGMEMAQAKANEIKDNMLKTITQRVDGSLKKVINPNGGVRYGSGLGGGKGWGYGRGWW